MRFESLRERVWRANRDIARSGLAILTWGNASEADRDEGVFAIKPSGVDYAQMTPESIVVLSLDTGEKLDGDLSPSSDTPTHWHLYRSFASIGGIVHTHSPHATAWAQAECPIPCLGTSHCDYFYGDIPCTRALTREEVLADYELNTGIVIAEHFSDNGLDPERMPAAIVSRHAPFTWGRNSAAAVENAVVLEETARTAALTRAISPLIGSVPDYLLDKHFLRKHGSKAYYGQVKQGELK
jgi:L-ribulose-5-phosphate 4-epimerase